jgi:hypothetical protein
MQTLLTDGRRTFTVYGIEIAMDTKFVSPHISRCHWRVGDGKAVRLLFSVAVAVSISWVRGESDPVFADAPDFFKTEDGRYLWQEAHADVLPGGDLQLSQHPFQFNPGESIRYIDYESGDDSNPGTRDAPWKHHPWDPQASVEAGVEDVDTFVFKRGVDYRGVIEVRQSGSPGRTVQFTSEPGWGEGEAVLSGAEVLEGPWRKVADEDAPRHLRLPLNVWAMSLENFGEIHGIWEIRDDGIHPFVLARTPNWVLDPALPDLREDWYEYASTSRPKKGPRKLLPREPGHPVGVEPGNPLLGVDSGRLEGFDPEMLKGALLRGESGGMMGYNEVAVVEAFDPETRVIESNYPRYRSDPEAGSRYFLEGKMAFLDFPGEYIVHDNILYVKLAPGRSPAGLHFEAATRSQILRLIEADHIEVSGLSFRFNGNPDPMARPFEDGSYPHPAAIYTRGSITGLQVRNCRFIHVPLALTTHLPEEKDRLDLFTIADNHVFRSGEGGMLIGRPSRRSGSIRFLRNDFQECGLTYPMPAADIKAWRLCHAAGNFAYRCGSQGLNIFMGKEGHLKYDTADVPLIRNLVHNNRAEDCMKMSNDFGQIEIWQGGPHYVFNNVSADPNGYWNRVFSTVQGDDERTYRSARFAFSYYLDGAFKAYVFNNLAWGRSNDLRSRLANASALQETLGHQCMVFNNTFHRFGAAFVRHLPEAGRNAYLGNILDDMSDCYFRQDNWNPRRRQPDAAFAYQTMAIARNFFSGPAPNYFGQLMYMKPEYPTLEDFREGLMKWHPIDGSIGTRLEHSPLVNPGEGDFRPRSDSAVRGEGVRVFVPWGLSGVVGEWHFHQYPEQTAPVIYGEEFYMRPELMHRKMYQHVPRWNLTPVGFERSDFTNSPLEDWIPGALRFNGRDQYCILEDRLLRKAATYEFQSHPWHPKVDRTFDGSNRKTLDIQEGNFLIEIVFSPDESKTACLVRKMDGGFGYQLDMDENGNPQLTLASGGKIFRATGALRFDPGKWHHLIVEVDRHDTEQPVRMYVDGKPVVVERGGVEEVVNAPLSNAGDFLVGSNGSEDFFAGRVGFLRLARGTLRDAHTTIKELYAWQFDGPFLRDFAGVRPPDGARDAGALQSSAP